MNIPGRSIPKHISRKTGAIIARFPLAIFLIFIALLVGLVVVGNKLRKPAAAPAEAAPEVKTVSVYQLGKQPRILVQGKVEKSGVINVMAQTPGIVQKIYKKEGDKVKRGTQLLTLSTNYTGGNVPALGRKVAQTNYKFLEDNYQAQKDIINTQRDLANKGNSMAGELREIGRKSIDETKSLISLNDDIVSSLDKQIKQLELTNVGGSNDTLILQSKQGKSQTVAALNSLRAALRNTEYNTNDASTPAQLSNTQKDLTLRQLDLQEKTLDLTKELSSLNVKISQVTESLMYPAATCPGEVERIYVKVGQSVSPGTLLATLRAKDNQATVVLSLSTQLAQSLSRSEPTILLIGDKRVSVFPSHISQEPTEGTLHSVTYAVPEGFDDKLVNNSTISIELPIGYAQVSKTSPYIPLDSIYQTQDSAYVYVVGQNAQSTPAAELRQVQLGQVYGQFVQVNQGLELKDQVILNRSVQTNDLIKLEVK